MENGIGQRSQPQRDVCLLPIQGDGPENKGNPSFLAVCPLQSSLRLPVLALQKAVRKLERVTIADVHRILVTTGF